MPDRTKGIDTPFTAADARSLRAGDSVRLNGVIYTARDAAHQRLTAALARGEQAPLPLRDQVIYSVGPTPATAGRVIGPAGPTTSGRLDPFTAPLLAAGVRGFIGKGHRSAAIVAALAAHSAVYFAAIGGAAALLARHIVASEIVAYPDLGTEAIRALTVRDFPVIVINDCFGGDAYQAGRARYEKRPPAGGE